jgi:undecaprenyl-diphosphatase
MWLESIIEADKNLFVALHEFWSCDALDALMPWFRNSLSSVPIYIFLLYFSVKKYGRNGLLWCLAFLLVFALTDFTSAHLLKPYFGRLRPCQDPLLGETIGSIVTCGSGQSFPSSHSSNHFGMTFFILFTLGKQFRWIKTPAVVWAVLVVVAQVYVGVHYPLDILGGMILGLGCASLVSALYHHFLRPQEFKIKK